MTRARDIANIIGSGATSSGVITAATLEATGDTAAGDNAAIGFTSAEGLILTGQGTTGDVTIKNDADALVAHVPTGTTGVTFAGTPTFPDGSINIADLDIDGGTDIGAALVDADLMVVDDGAGGTNRKATLSRLATYMGTKVGGGAMEFIVSSGAISNAASVAFTQFDSSKYDAYAFYYYYVIPATDNVYFVWNSSTDGGSSYAESNGDYRYGQSGAGGNVAFGYVNASYQVGSGTNEFGITGAINLMHPHNTTTFKYFQSSSGPTYGKTNGEIATDTNDYGNSYRISTADIDAIRFKFTSGNIESGEIVMYGIKNA